MERSLAVGQGTEVPLAEIRLRYSRSSGPGGQHANVTASRAEAVFDVGKSRSLTVAERERLRRVLGERVSAVAQDSRSQARNRELALERLRAKLAEALREPAERRPTRPTPASRRRRLAAKRQRGELKRLRRRPEGDWG